MICFIFFISEKIIKTAESVTLVTRRRVSPSCNVTGPEGVTIKYGGSSAGRWSVN